MIKSLRPSLKRLFSSLSVFEKWILVVRRARDLIRKKKPLRLLKKNTGLNWLTVSLLACQVPRLLDKTRIEPEAIVVIDGWAEQQPEFWPLV